MRIKKLRTPIFFTTTTKFGVELIQSAPKKCHFRYDLVWVKTVPTGFLCAKKMPMRKHEMVYVFYEKLPFYDLSSHTHKFIKDKEPVANEEYEKREKKVRNTIKKEENYGKGYLDKKVNFRKYDPTLGGKGAPSHLYDPPLPVSVVQEEGCYGEKVPNSEAKYGQKCARQYDPPLPTSMLEVKSTKGKHSTEKPVALMEWIFKYYSKEGDTILDPTMGSGSTGVACKNMNRKFIGIEMDEDIFEIATKRLN
jgi:site-specific DNA-methyltransferase (adenine-specific)